MIHKDIIKYNNQQTGAFGKICELLSQEISAALTSATSKIYYSMPVWLIEDNPIVGYNVRANCVNLLFWSGQSFDEPDLKKEGSFKAAEIKYQTVDDVDVEDLRRWLKKSEQIQWDYKNIRKNQGKLNLIKND